MFIIINQSPDLSPFVTRWWHGFGSLVWPGDAGYDSIIARPEQSKLDVVIGNMWFMLDTCIRSCQYGSSHTQVYMVHTHMQARMHPRMHARTHARTHSYTHARAREQEAACSTCVVAKLKTAEKLNDPRRSPACHRSSGDGWRHVWPVCVSLQVCHVHTPEATDTCVMLTHLSLLRFVSRPHTWDLWHMCHINIPKTSGICVTLTHLKLDIRVTYTILRLVTRVTSTSETCDTWITSTQLRFVEHVPY